jgi:AraC-like DNA-binding protein
MVSGQLDRIFGGCREKSSHIGIVEFNQSALRRPMRLSDAAVSLALQAYLKSTTFGAAADQELTEIVRGLVSASMGTAPIALVDIAAILGIPSRTLQYSLRKSGMSFRRIVEHCRHAVARSDLALGKSVTETAAKLGYEHIQNFSAAFSAWEGTTPSRFAANPRSARKILDTLNT